MNKSNLRKELIAKRKSITDKSQKDTQIYKNLIALPQFTKARSVLTYVSTSIEVDTKRLIEHCFNRNIPVAIPVIIDETMRFFRIDNLEDFPENEFTDFTDSICIVPALAYNRDNYRLGYGGGFYDRFLRNYSGVKIGLCYEEFLTDIPVEEHDERVDIIVWNQKT
jgi:5-formyltetrahydrofolate cyclo-ligase